MYEPDKLNILVVDDLPEKLLVYQAILDELEQNVITASSGADALKQLLTHDCAVILLDVNMPIMDGFETASLIRQRKRSAHTPIIFVTAYADEVQAAQGYATGAVDFILSPVVPDILRTKVRVFCDLYRMGQLARRQAEERVALAEAQAQRRAAEEASRRFAFLAEAGRVLMDSLTLGERVCDLTRLPVTILADVAAVRLLDERGRTSYLAVAWQEGQGALCKPFADAEIPRPVREAIDAARSSTVTQQLELELDEGAAPGTPFAGLETASLLCVPLRYREHLLGVMALLRPAARGYQCDDVSLATSLGTRGALAIENVRLYEQLQEADRRKDEFMAMLAHELRNPLAPIRNAVAVLQRSGDNAERLVWARELIGRQVQHLVRLVDDLLDVARITRGKIQMHVDEIDLATVVGLAVESCKPLIETRGHQLTVRVTDQRLHAKGDPARLAQVLSNLLNNAAKYTEPGGRIALELAREGEAAVFRVRDSGIGIPPEQLAHVFDPFFQIDRSLDRAHGGLGIGLTLVRSIAEMHGGQVEASSDGAGRGTELVVRLPILLPEEALWDAADSSPTPVCAQRRILIVDDNRDAALSLAELLRLEGHELHVVHDGPHALAALEEFSPEVVLLDIGLPGMDGYQVARQLRAEPRGKDLLLVAVTGYGQKRDKQLSREAGFDHHLIKPVELKTLVRLLSAVSPSPPVAIA